MSLRGRNLITIDDFFNEEIEAVLDAAAEMESDLREQAGRLQGAILASLFFEPSTRTRLSFETAMLRLGGQVVSATDVTTSSIAKGESLADTARVVSKFTDLLVIRPPWEGSARLMAAYSDVPVVNAGDGGHEHPRQTLLDLYTLRKEKGGLRGLTVPLCGDLKNGRTIHSLAYAIARFGSNILCLPGEGLGLPDYVTDKLRDRFACAPGPEGAGREERPLLSRRGSGIPERSGVSENGGDAPPPPGGRALLRGGRGSQEPVLRAGGPGGAGPHGAPRPASGRLSGAADIGSSVRRGDCRNPDLPEPGGRPLSERELRLAAGGPLRDAGVPMGGGFPPSPPASVRVLRSGSPASVRRKPEVETLLSGRPPHPGEGRKGLDFLLLPGRG